MKKNIQLISSFVISAVLLCYVAFSLEWKLVLKSMSEVNFLWLGASVIIMTLHYLFRAMRWRVLIPSELEPDKISLKLLFDSVQLGNFGTYVFPLRAGEFIRPLFLSLKSNVPFASGFASVVVERFFDLSAVLLCFGLLVGIQPDLPEWAPAGASILSLIAIGLLTFLIVGSFAPALCISITKFFLKPLPSFMKEKLLTLAEQIISSTSVLRSVKKVLLIILFTALVWGSCFALFYAFLKAFIPVFPLGLPLGLLVIIALAVAAPSAPGFLGVYQTACIATFSLFGFSKELAGAFSIVTHALQYVLFIGYGVVVMLQSGVGVRELRGER